MAKLPPISRGLVEVCRSNTVVSEFLQLNLAHEPRECEVERRMAREQSKTILQCRQIRLQKMGSKECHESGRSGIEVLACGYRRLRTFIGSYEVGVGVGVGAAGRTVSLAELKLAPDAQFDLGPLISSGAACRGYLADGKDVVLVKAGSNIEISSSHGGKVGSNVNVNGVALDCGLVVVVVEWCRAVISHPDLDLD